MAAGVGFFVFAADVFFWTVVVVDTACCVLVATVETSGAVEAAMGGNAGAVLWRQAAYETPAMARITSMMAKGPAYRMANMTSAEGRCCCAR